MLMVVSFMQFRSGIDKQFLAAPVKSAVDKFQLLPEFLKVLVALFLKGFWFSVAEVLLFDSFRFPFIFIATVEKTGKK